jgi:hypothetical protein
MLLFGAGREEMEQEDGPNRAARVAAGVVVVLLCVNAIYPQAAVEWLARPAVAAMAGGVAAPTEVVRNWGVGLQVVSTAEAVEASLPATGLAVGVFVAWVVLYWMRRIVAGSQ